MLAAAMLGTLALRPPDTSDPVLRRAIGYVATFEETFSAVTWHERYEQEDHESGGIGPAGPRITHVYKRLLEAHLLLVWLPRDASWVAVRDVVSVDGKPRPADDRPIERLSSGDSSITTAELMTLAAENGRYNIGRILRTFNEPTLTLTFLDDHYRQRFTFQRGDEETRPQGRARLFSFVEEERPTVIRNENGDVPASGTFWIDEATGRVLQTMMIVSTRDVRASMLVHYGPHPDFDVFVPLDMHERYDSKNGDTVTTVATYTDFRRFEAKGRLIFPR
jgi:hypothetical protein